jgi:hypothetical protein
MNKSDVDDCCHVPPPPPQEFMLLVDCNTWESSVNIVTGYRLDVRGVAVRVPVGSRMFSSIHIVQTGSGAHPASYPMVTGGSFPGGKAAGA